ncbi:MAG TPA: hypothetical protein VGF49_11940 [Candidatus Solibacter sp.]|jgi:hypothetical protein
MAKTNKSPHILTITIKSACETDPRHPHMSLAGYDGVTWHAAPPNLYYLALPAGLFQGFPDRFIWPVFGAIPTTPLLLVDPLPSALPAISNYIYDPLGTNCASVAASDPPDIIIDSGPFPPVKKKDKKKKKKKKK